MSIYFCFRQELPRGVFEHNTKPKLKWTSKFGCPRFIQNVSVVIRDGIKLVKKFTLEQATKAQKGVDV